MSVLELDGVSKAYRGRPLFQDVGFSVEAGSSTALVGPNGSGKSVLLRIMCRFIAPDNGTVRIAPEFLSNDRVFPQDVGVIIDRPGYLGGRSGLENLLTLAEIRALVDEGHVRTVMNRLLLDPDDRTPVRKYSLGMKQKLAIAQAVMEEQRVLILDEPFNALDDTSRTAVVDLLREFRADGGTLFFTSHVKEEVAELAESVLKLDAQRVIRQ